MNEFISKQAAIDLCNQILVRSTEETDIVKVISALIFDLMNLSSTQLEQQWIPVSKKLPELREPYKLSDDVLITNGIEIYMGYIMEVGGKIFWHFYGPDGVMSVYGDVTGWMPLPKPLKTES